jgi:hypothetical protein
VVFDEAWNIGMFWFAVGIVGMQNLRPGAAATGATTSGFDSISWNSSSVGKNSANSSTRAAFVLSLAANPNMPLQYSDAERSPAFRAGGDSSSPQNPIPLAWTESLRIGTLSMTAEEWEVGLALESEVES